ILLSALQGLINAFDTPTRQALLIDLIESREDLANAIALNSSMVNAARLVGPSLAGIIIAARGEGLCFLIDGISYIAVGAVLLAARSTVRGLGRVLVQSTLVFGAGLIALPLSHRMWLSLILMAATGFGMMVQIAVSNTLLQTIVEDDKRGRVMGLYTMAF